jgi:hypothetical protein
VSGFMLGNLAGCHPVHAKGAWVAIVKWRERELFGVLITNYIHRCTMLTGSYIHSNRLACYNACAAACWPSALTKLERLISGRNHANIQIYERGSFWCSHWMHNHRPVVV